MSLSLSELRIALWPNQKIVIQNFDFPRLRERDFISRKRIFSRACRSFFVLSVAGRLSLGMARSLLQRDLEIIQRKQKNIYYSVPQCDAVFEYRYVLLPGEWNDFFPRMKFLSPDQLHDYGIRMSEGWVHYAVQPHEPLVLLFRRRITAERREKEEQLCRNATASEAEAIAIRQAALRAARQRKVESCTS